MLDIYVHLINMPITFFTYPETIFEIDTIAIIISILKIFNKQNIYLNNISKMEITRNKILINNLVKKFFLRYLVDSITYKNEVWSPPLNKKYSLIYRLYYT